LAALDREHESRPNLTAPQIHVHHAEPRDPRALSARGRTQGMAAVASGAPGREVVPPESKRLPGPSMASFKNALQSSSTHRRQKAPTGSRGTFSSAWRAPRGAANGARTDLVGATT
jgi:hypothetical protein